MRPRNTAPGAPAIELVGVNKSFGPVHANKDIALKVEPGTIHGIIGENGAGKSTLMSILYGFYEADSGEILISGKPTAIRSSRDAIDAGIGMVHQHFMLVDTMSVVENIMLGAESGAILTSSIEKARAELGRLERDYNLDVDPDALAGELPVGQQQRVHDLQGHFAALGLRDLVVLVACSEDAPEAALADSSEDVVWPDGFHL